MRMKHSRLRALLVLLWITAIHAIGLYLFTTGFFLTRFEVPDVSECRVPSSQYHGASSRLRSFQALRSFSPSSSDDASPASGSCWMPRRFRRIVFVVIDALRFDFVRSSPAFSSSPSSTSSPSFYLNRLPILQSTLQAQPNHSVLLKFIADPPTMTMQRLKGLTTGSLPTFLDIKDNMASSEIAEDNLLLQMRRADRPIVFMGDDTWDALYRKSFTRKYSFDSFNVKDLHSVDRGVVKHLFPELAQNDWDLLIAHFLGVDHVGHTHGPSSPFMTEKLDEMNAILTKLLEELAHSEAEDTLLLIMGDHGMSADGNHGGASDDETGAALFAYSKQSLVDSSVSDKWPQEVPQVDLVPTLALLAGLPIPFGNLGAVIPQFIPSQQTLAEALRLNVAQVRRYLVTYSAASKLPESAFETLERIYGDIQTLTGDTERVDELVATQYTYLREALALGRSIWTQFDLHGMGWGFAVLVAGQGLVLWHLIALVKLSMSGVAVGAAAGALLGSICPASILLLPRSVASRMLCLGALGSCATVVAHAGLALAEARLLRRPPNPSAIVVFATMLLHALALLSNSYIVAEDRVMQFLSVTVGCFLVWFSQRHAPATAKIHAVLAALGFTVASRVVGAIDSPNIIHSTTSVSRTWLPLVLIVFGPFFIQQRPLARQALVSSAAVAWAAVACGSYWHWSPITWSLARLWLPRSVFLVMSASTGRRMWLAWVATHRRSVGDDAAFGALLLLTLSLVLGPKSPLTMLCLALQYVCFIAVARLSFGRDQPPPLSWVLLWCVPCYHSFFTTGHQNTFTSLQNAAGFVGFDEFHFYWAGALLAFNTFGSYALALLVALPLLDHKAALPWRALLSVVAYFALNALVSTAFVALQRRHLMVWAIFAPKFIFDGAALLVVDLLGLVVLATAFTQPSK